MTGLVESKLIPVAFIERGSGGADLARSIGTLQERNAWLNSRGIQSMTVVDA